MAAGRRAEPPSLIPRQQVAGGMMLRGRRKRDAAEDSSIKMAAAVIAVSVAVIAVSVAVIVVSVAVNSAASSQLEQLIAIQHSRRMNGPMR